MADSIEDDEEILSKSAASILGVKGRLRVRLHGSTQKAHIVLRRVEVPDDDSSDEEPTGTAYFSLFAMKKIDVKPGKEILLAIDGHLKDRPIRFVAEDTEDNQSHIGTETDFHTEPDYIPSLEDKIDDCTMPPRMRKLWVRKVDEVNSCSYPPTAVTHTSIAVQAYPEYHSSYVQANPISANASIQTEPLSVTCETQTEILTFSSFGMQTLALTPQQFEPHTKNIEGIVLEPSSAIRYNATSERSLSPMDIESVSSTRASSPCVSPLLKNILMPELSRYIPKDDNGIKFSSPDFVVSQENNPNPTSLLLGGDSLKPTGLSNADDSESDSSTVKDWTRSLDLPFHPVEDVFSLGDYSTSAPSLQKLPSNPKTKLYGTFVSSGFLTDPFNEQDKVLSREDIERVNDVPEDFLPLPATLEPVGTGYYNAAVEQEPIAGHSSQLELPLSSLANTAAPNPVVSITDSPVHTTYSDSYANSIGLQTLLQKTVQQNNENTELSSAPPSTPRIGNAIVKDTLSPFPSPQPTVCITPGPLYNPLSDRASAQVVLKKTVPTGPRALISIKDDVGNATPNAPRALKRKQNQDLVKFSQRKDDPEQVPPVPSSVLVDLPVKSSSSLVCSVQHSATPLLPSKPKWKKIAVSDDTSALTTRPINQPEETRPTVPTLETQNMFDDIKAPSAELAKERKLIAMIRQTLQSHSSALQSTSPLVSMKHPLPVKPTLPAEAGAGTDSKKRRREPSLEVSPRSPRRRRLVWPVVPCLHRVHLHGDGDIGIRHISFSPDGEYFALACLDRTVRIWQNSGRKEVARLAHNAAVSSVLWISDGIGIITLGYDGIVSQWIKNGKNQWHWTKLIDTGEKNTPEGQVLMTYKMNRIGISYPHCGVKIWIYSQGSWRQQQHIKQMSVSALQFTHDGSALLGGTRDGSLWYCEVPSGSLRLYGLFKSTITSIDINQTGSHALISQQGKPAMLIDISTPGKKGYAQCIFTSAELTSKSSSEYDFGARLVGQGRGVMYGTVQGCVLVWDTKTASVVYALEHGEDDPTLASANFNGTSLEQGTILTGTRNGELLWWPPPKPV